MPPCWKRKRDRSGPCVTGARPVLLFGWERAWLGSGHQQVEGAAVCDALVQEMCIRDRMKPSRTWPRVGLHRDWATRFPSSISWMARSA